MNGKKVSFDRNLLSAAMRHFQTLNHPAVIIRHDMFRREEGITSKIFQRLMDVEVSVKVIFDTCTVISLAIEMH
ncbi:hypothetical protein [Polycladomyces subterraneus]|uniref:Uncharacterized protein n=1 Tax=Polycladomyces subterraneus TaxID=1016997 RepID=A0ABT8IK76_9BACL|nr:hypothetical protein [Polycladomyces subterraneus]MDN4593183.1 hypothetical protein [Polycladomyces subterraneus]